MIKRKKRFAVLAGLVVLGAVLVAAAFVPSVSSRLGVAGRYIAALTGQYLPIDVVDTRYVRQIITKDSSTSRTIMWQSTLAEEQALIEYRQQGAGDSQIQTVSASNRPFTDNGRTVYLHEGTLEGLSPATAYEYRVGYENRRSQWYDLKTAGGGDFTALVFPDSQSSDYRDWQNLVRVASEKNPGAEFFINMGDLVDNGEDASQWDAWFDAVEPMIARIPFSGIMGNHETYDLNWKVREPLAYLNLFQFPSNGLKQYENQFYSYDYNDVHFVVLDTQFDEEKDYRPELLQAEMNWLRQDLAASRATWKVILMHKEVLSYPNVRRPDFKAGVNDLGRTFMPVFDEFNVDLVLTAHYHTYRRRGHIENFTRSSAGPYYILTGVAGNVRYSNLWGSHPLDEFVAPQPETDNYLTLTKTGNTLTVQSFFPDGSLMDKATLTK